MKEIHQRNSCRLCRSNNLKLAFQLKPSPIADAFVKDINAPEQPLYPLELSLCMDCRHLQLINVIDPMILFKEYFFMTSSSPGLVEHFTKYVDTLMETVSPQKGTLVIDIGSNDGTLLNFFKQAGMRVLGIDPAENIAEKANADGIETIPAFFTERLAVSIRESHGSAAIITANNVFAHADDMGTIAGGISHLLANDGVFVFEVSYLVHIVERMLFDTIYHEHLCYHCVKPLTTFLDRYGMELVGIEYAPTKGGSLHGVAQLKGGPRKVSGNVGDMIQMEEEKGYDTIEVYRDFERKIEKSKNLLTRMLKSIQEQNKIIAGYGSSQTCTTLSYHFGINPFLAFIVDDNPDKHGLFSPGYHLPIIDSGELYKRKTDYVIILAWQYATPIIKRHVSFVENGGKIIIPLPNPIIVDITNIQEWDIQ